MHELVVLLIRSLLVVCVLAVGSIGFFSSSLVRKLEKIIDKKGAATVPKLAARGTVDIGAYVGALNSQSRRSREVLICWGLSR
eukprot:1392998-Amphidinium_carterae.1